MKRTAAEAQGLQAGWLVRSITGRDRSRLYLVLAVSQDRVLLTDGDKRGVDHCKTKNTSHVGLVDWSDRHTFLKELADLKDPGRQNALIRKL